LGRRLGAGAASKETVRRTVHPVLALLSGMSVPVTVEPARAAITDVVGFRIKLIPEVAAITKGSDALEAAPMLPAAGVPESMVAGQAFGGLTAHGQRTGHAP